MALLGTGGILELSREWPEPMALKPDALNASTSVLSIGNPGYWTGDRIIFASADGLPIDANGDGYADCPEGHGIYYGSIYDLGPARIHVTAADDNYYQADNSVAFYNTAATTGLLEQSDAYINMDALDRAKLYTGEIPAHNADAGSLVALKSVKVNNMVVTRYDSSSTYTNAINTAIDEIKPLTLPSTTQKLKDVITVPAGFAAISDDADERGWLVQCDLTEWALSVDADNLDMTAIGDTFGENTKSLVRGAGTLQFLLDNKAVSDEQSSMALLRIVMLTERQAKSSAKFHLYRNRTPVSPQVGTTAYYGCDILLTNSRLNIKADDIIAGSADFVATGEIALRFEP